MILHLGHNGEVKFKFKIRNTPVAKLWVERMESRGIHPLDHPNRFYGFNSLEEEKKRAIDEIQQSIKTINDYKSIINKPFTFDQDGLNYLHNIFERYHGLLDQQDTDFWYRAPVPVCQALAKLNLDVHRCESVMANNSPRLVCTWFGMPKIHCLDIALQKEYGSMQLKFGTVYLNYCEIGKTVEDLANDQDEYISAEAFKPFNYYSADFNIAFHNRDLSKKIPVIEKYFQKNIDFFIARQITSVSDIRALPIRFPIADLDEIYSCDELLSIIKQHQYVQKVTID
jgi:hypothetical protein